MISYNALNVALQGADPRQLGRVIILLGLEWGFLKPRGKFDPKVDQIGYR